MTIETEETVKYIREILQALAAVVVLLTAVAGVVVWMTGGFTPQTQVATADLSRKITEMSGTVKQIQERFELMPRPSDYLSQDVRLGRIDMRLDEMNKRLTQDEIDYAGLRSRVLGQDGKR